MIFYKKLCYPKVSLELFLCFRDNKRIGFALYSNHLSAALLDQVIIIDDEDIY